MWRRRCEEGEQSPSTASVATKPPTLCGLAFRLPLFGFDWLPGAIILDEIHGGVRYSSEIGDESARAIDVASVQIENETSLTIRRVEFVNG